MHSPTTGEATRGVRAVLSRPGVYDWWSRLVGSHQSRTTLVREHVRPWPNARVLDLGCGTGELLEYLGDVRYCGVDISAQYISHARVHYGDRAEFRVGDASAADLAGREFDIVVSLGVLHHLDDPSATRLLRLGAESLTPEGRLVTLDGAFLPTQSMAARFVLERDRGNHVRTPDEYVSLAAPWFADVKPFIREDLVRIPYTHCVLECQAKRGLADPVA